MKAESKGDRALYTAPPLAFALAEYDQAGLKTALNNVTQDVLIPCLPLVLATLLNDLESQEVQECRNRLVRQMRQMTSLRYVWVDDGYPAPVYCSGASATSCPDYAGPDASVVSYPTEGNVVLLVRVGVVVRNELSKVISCSFYSVTHARTMSCPKVISCSCAKLCSKFSSTFARAKVWTPI